MKNNENKLDNLLITKLEVPQIDKRIVSRQRLTAMLDEGLHRSLSLVIAPTGYGKTTILVEWVLNRINSNSRIAWVNLDRYSNPPLRFWAYIVFGIKKAIPSLRYNLEEYVQQGYNEQNFFILNPLLNEIANLEEEVILILDDFHTITDQIVLQSLMYFIEHKPGNLHVVISGRKMPDLSLSRLLAQRQLLQITQQDLTFTHKETEIFLNQIMDLNVSQEQITRMLETSEGWIAGIQLAGLSYQSWPELDLLKNRFSNNNRQIYDYLTQEVLNSQDESTREFLLKTSILKVLTAPLCDYVLDTTDSQAMLEKIGEANLFLVCLDFPNCDYRYHSLFAETLQNHLAQTYPDLVPELHRRACTWMLDHKMPEKAITHAIAAGDLEWAAEILDLHAISALRSHDIFNLAKWIGHLTEDLFAKHPQLGIYSAFVNYHLGRIDQTSENLRQVNQLINGPSGEQYKEEEKIKVQWESDALTAVLHTTTKNFSEALESMHSVLEDPPEVDSFFINFLHLNLAYTYEILGDLSAANRFYIKGYENAVAQKDILSQFRILLDVSRLEKVQGDLFTSEKTLNQCYQICDRHQLDDSYKIFVTTALLERALEKCDYENAHALVTEVLKTLLDVIDNPRLWLRLELIYSTIVEYFLAVQDREKLKENFNQMLKYTPSIRGDLPDMPWNLIDVQVRGWLGLEGDARSSKHINEIKAFLNNKSARMLEEQIALNRIFLAQGQLSEAQSGLEQLGKSLASSQLREYWLQALVLLSLVYWKQGDEPSAFDTIKTALDYGLSQGFMMIFVREGAEMRALLQTLFVSIEAEANQKPLKEYTQRIISGIENIEQGEIISPPIGTGTSPTSDKDRVVLSEREIEVLQLLSEGKAYKEIALQLNISINTVKSHVKHIYNKLNVSSRKELYKQAREFKLID